MFNGLLKSFVTNGLINLGEEQNPLTGKREINLNQASYSIKMLEMIKEKTAGNLNKNETNTLQKALTKLKILFVQVSEDNNKK
jgi:hypothetical protein